MGDLADTFDVSVIMPAYDALPHLADTLDSLAAQTIGADRVQAILVDDGSTDGTASLLDAYAREHPNVTVIHQPNSGGPAQPRNRALDLVRGRYVFFLDADDRLDPDALRAMVNVADEQGTEVVLGKLVGFGGRNVPQSMFRETQPRTDVFESMVYWTLNPMKLFRTELIERLGLRFRTDLPWGEDQPFVAAAYFGASGISVLADRDYVYWGYRDDLRNITTQAISLAERLPVADCMFDFVAEKVPPGPARDKLMWRHFRVELLGSAFVGFDLEPEGPAKRAAFERFEELVRDYYTPEIESWMLVHGRVLMHLVRAGDYEAFVDYLARVRPMSAPAPLVEGDRVFVPYPGFRDPSSELPDELFDVTARARLSRRIVRLAGKDDAIECEVAAGLGVLSDRIAEVELIFVHRESDRIVRVALDFEANGEPGDFVVMARGAMPAATLCDEATGEGHWDVSLAAVADGLRRERRIRGQDVAAQRPYPAACVHGSDGVWRSLKLYLTENGNLSAHVIAGLPVALSSYAHRQGGRVDRLTVVTADCVALGDRPQLVLTDERGRMHRLNALSAKKVDRGLRLTFDTRRLRAGTQALGIAPEGSSEVIPARVLRSAEGSVSARWRTLAWRAEGRELRLERA